MNKIQTNTALVAFLALCFIHLNGCSGGSGSGDSKEVVVGEPTSQNDTIYLDSGVKYVYMKKGEGAPIDSLAKVKTHINLIIAEDTVWSTYADDVEILEFTAKKTSLIAGFDEVVMYIREGDRILAVIPPELGYGKDGSGELIPGNATLFFDLDILEVIPEDSVTTEKP